MQGGEKLKSFMKPVKDLFTQIADDYSPIILNWAIKIQKVR